MPDLAALMPQIAAEWAAIDFAGIAASFQQFIDNTEEMMIGWVPIGDVYVKPIDWEELWLIEPQGVEYAAYRHHINMDERIFVGVAATPAAAARLITGQVRTAAGEVDHDEPRINHGLAPRRDGAARLRRANEREVARQRLNAAREQVRAGSLVGEAIAESIEDITSGLAPYSAGGGAGTTTFTLAGTEPF